MVEPCADQHSERANTMNRRGKGWIEAQLEPHSGEAGATLLIRFVHLLFIKHRRAVYGDRAWTGITLRWVMPGLMGLARIVVRSRA
jgi:hypothetical protein